MTLLSSGSGHVAVRLVIEGLPTEFVSDPGMEKTTSDGRRRVYCLPPMGEGVVIDESVNIQEALLEGQGVSIRLFETKDEDVSQVFAYRPSIETFISATVEQADAYVSLLSVDGLAEDDVVHVGTEAMLVTAVGAATITVTRAYWQTIAQKHWSNTGGVPYRVLTNRPLRVRGRRAYLYLYSDGDDLQGDGTRIWLGTVTADPSCDGAGTEWQLQIASIAARLQSKIGGELDSPLRPRGIYYHAWAPLRVELEEDSNGPSAHLFTGYFETQREFIEALDAAIITWTSGWTHSYHAVEDGAGGWTISLTTSGTSTNLKIAARSPIDGECWSGVGSLGITPLVDIDGVPYTSVASGMTVYPQWQSYYHMPTRPAGPVSPRTVPRGYFGRPPPELTSDGSAAADHPSTRIYLDRPIASDWTEVLIEWASGASHTYRVLDINTTEGWVLLRNDFAIAGGRYHSESYGHGYLPTLSPLRHLATGNLGDLRDALVTEGPEYANRGTAPFLTTEDLADWSSVADTTETAITTRHWALAVAADLEEVLSAEMRLAGVFPVIESDGRIGIRPITLGGAAIDLDDEIISAHWSSIARGGQTINRVVVKICYDPREDDWATKREVFDLSSYAQDHQDRVVDIEPRSRSVIGDVFLSPEHDYAPIGVSLFALFGYPYDMLRVAVPWTYFQTALLGTPVRFSADHLPDFLTGRRPMANVQGIVIARRWALGEPYGDLTILVSWLGSRGYAPTARVVDQTDNGGDEWTIEVDPSMYAPSGADDEYFEAGDKVRVIQYDSESPTVVTGTVVSVDTGTHEIVVQFDATWTPGASTWELCFQPYDQQTVSQRAAGYAAIAESDGTLDGDGPALFGP